VTTTAQAWTELRTEDPEAFSAHAVARGRLAAGRRLDETRRLRVVEIAGSAKNAREIEDLLHASTQFYNPHKERCRLRTTASDPGLAPPDACLVLVWERGGERRPAAERWWRHETGETVTVREGIVWALRFAAGVDALDAASELALARDARHGLLCNPHAQELRMATALPPLEWIGPMAGGPAHGGL